MIKLLCMTVRGPAVISHVLCFSFWIADRPPNATFLFGSVSGGHARSMRFTRGWASGGED
jgi:hypothetical protein